jgi:hypothetical protein
MQTQSKGKVNKIELILMSIVISKRDKMSFMFRLSNKPVEFIQNEITEPAKSSRRILSHTHIRSLIDENYTRDINWFSFASISGITAVLKRKYSPDITADMVFESLALEPAYKVSHNMDAPGCRFIKRIR